jgi:uncharacterized membrane protein HdeD (DUF308 family)
MTENTLSFLTSERTQKTLAVVLILSGLLQAASALGQDSRTWLLFYGFTGLITAICGVFFLRAEMDSSE